MVSRARPTTLQLCEDTGSPSMKCLVPTATRPNLWGSKRSYAPQPIIVSWLKRPQHQGSQERPQHYPQHYQNTIVEMSRPETGKALGLAVEKIEAVKEKEPPGRERTELRWGT
mmetsp:Transcript_2104/g.5017  ORF Transcript_2104/g.5017 Transcript_2104/m.5017 type:complete len:113 (+) Transcript_2104:906-1244(+)